MDDRNKLHEKKAASEKNEKNYRDENSESTGKKAGAVEQETEAERKKTAECGCKYF